MKLRCFSLATGLMLCACAGPAAESAEHGNRPRLLRTAADARRPAARRPSAKAESAPALKPSEVAERQERNVGVQGIEGTMSNFDVRVTMEKYNKAFATCHEPRARHVPALAGSIEFSIHVLRDGKVEGVQVRDSDLGDRVLERCLSEVILAAKFPEPHGGEADVKWNMLLAPSGKGREPELWEVARVERVVQKRRRELLETCDARGAGLVTITAYVSGSGRVLAAGVAAKDSKVISADQFDCIAEELRRWEMPKPRKGIAKVSFPIRTGA